MGVIEFGEDRQSMLESTNSLARRIQKGFLIRTTVSEDAIWSIIEQSSSEIPDKKSFLTVSGARVYVTKRDGVRVVGYGALARGQMALASWALAVRMVTGGFHLYLHFGRANGQLMDSLSMERLLQIVTLRLREVDPPATLEFFARASPSNRPRTSTDDPATASIEGALPIADAALPSQAVDWPEIHASYPGHLLEALQLMNTLDSPPTDPHAWLTELCRRMQDGASPELAAKRIPRDISGLR